MAGKKIDILKKAAEVAVDSIADEESLLIVAKFSATFELLTGSSPISCTKENKTKTKQKIIGLTFETGQSACNAVQLSFALKEFFESKSVAPEAGDIPRSIVIFSSGNLVNQASVDALLTAPNKVFDCRVSAIAVGSGAADGFLSSIAQKGQGLVEVLGVQEHIDERVQAFMTRLAKPTFRNVRFECLNTSVFQVLPIIAPNTSFLKGTPFEIFAYLKQSEDLEAVTSTSIVMHYLDDEDKKEKRVNIMFNQKSGTSNPDLYNLCINELISNKVDLQASKLDTELKNMIGEDWYIKLAKENNILTHDTAFLAVALDTPPVFFLGDDEEVFDEIEEEGLVASKKVVVKQMIADDYLSVKKVSEQGQNKSMSSKTLNARNFGLKIGDMKKKNDTTLSTFYSLNGSKGTDTDLSAKQSTSTFDDAGEKPQSLMSKILYEENTEERDLFKKALSVFHNKMRLPSYSDDEGEIDDDDTFKSGLKPFFSTDPSPRNYNPREKGSQERDIEFERKDSFELNEDHGMQVGDETGVDICKSIVDLQEQKGHWKGEHAILKLIGTVMEKISKAVTSTKLDITLVVTLACIQYLTSNFGKDPRAEEAIKKAKLYVASTKKIPAAQLALALKKVSEIVFPK